MENNVTDASPFEKILTVHIPAAALTAEEDKVARKLSREVKIKGFRPGHAPRRIVESVVGADRLRSDAIDELLPELVAQAVNDAELIPAVTPTVENITDVDDGVEVEVKVTLWPTVETLPEYRGRRVEVTSPTVDEEELNAQIQRVRDQFSELETVDRPVTEDDYVAIDISASRNGTPVEDSEASDLLVQAGAGMFVEGLDEHLIGKKAGDIFEFEGHLPEGFGDVGGAAVTYRVLVKEVKEKRLPDLTDEWVSDVTEFETVDELRDDLRKRIADAKKAATVAEIRSKALELVLDELDLEIPEGIVRAEMDEILHRFVHQLEDQGISLSDYFRVTGQSEEAFVDDLRQQALRNVRTDTVLEALGEAESIEVSDEEVDEVVAEYARQTGRDVDEFRAELGDQANAVRSDILKRKALEALTEAVVPVDEDDNEVILEDSAAEETE